jgi:outer membrane protein assembly factor BamB
MIPAADRSGQVTAFLWGDVFLGLDRASGERRWSYRPPTGCTAASGAAAEAGVIVVGLDCGGRNGATGIDATTGTQRWLWQPVTGGDHIAGMALGEGRVAVVSVKRRPVVDVASGRIMGLLPWWNQGAVVDGHRYYMLSTVISYGDLASGVALGDMTAPAQAVGGRLLAVQDGVVLVGTANGQITLVPSTVRPLEK